MKKNEVKIGQVYTAKVSNRVVQVRIDGAHTASEESTRAFAIKSAASN